MRFPRMLIEAESPEQLGYDKIKFNLTESSLRDRTLAELGLDLNDQILCYTDHLGLPPLREAIAARAGMQSGEVLLTAGAAAALFIVAVTLLDRGDHMIVVRPNYATNIETPRILGCQVECLDLKFEDGFALDLARLETMITPKTRLISLTTPHNPTGVALSAATLRAVAAMAERHDVHVLVDETYRDMSFVEKPPVAATLSERLISVSSLSKSYGIPGIRLGWIVSRDRGLNYRFLCAKEQIGICGSVVDEAIGLAAYSQADAWMASVQAPLKAAFDSVAAWIAAEPMLEWVEPSGGCVCFPRIVGEVDMAVFYATLNDIHGCYVGPGHWFEQDDRYFRLGYGWPLPAELAGGLKAISASLRKAAL
ncbi:aspartate/methionine/tyrosine aminotransferase [Caulobacter ginsengisoli]|uniref:Aminotransferase n=1 Tax=Caulobacter ginsengisoli TaxID=400775 RepID=A0ABU0IWS2_9CAUL|nr:pyridoxal phosphate-dependent aminotransferase [Caulobacter ginsengisoli]MDQ0465392.1 aspartate/methionine/tyrosine aminotransferase [Caulobacter ginsengisoli]